MATILNVDRHGKPLPMENRFTNIIVSRQIGAQHLAINYYTRYEPGGEFPQHVHEDSQDVLFVVTGSGWLKADDAHRVWRGDLRSPGEVHGVVAGATGMAILGCQAPPDPRREWLARETGP